MNKHFASDNWSGAHTQVIQRVADVCRGHVPAYGRDDYSEAVRDRFRALFGHEARVLFVFGGTGANVLAIQCAMESIHSVICASTAHLYTSECGAPEKFTGGKLIPVAPVDGKLLPERVEHRLRAEDPPHQNLPRVVSITQATELGTLYTAKEVRALARLSHKSGCVLHMDGARIANAAAGLDAPLRTFTSQAGVDVLSFGGTKNGMLGGEALVFLNPELAERAEYVRKQGMQLPSKCRFLAAQFDAMLTDDLWLTSAHQANAMALRLRDQIQDAVEIAWPVESNAVFARIPAEHVRAIRERYYFYYWDRGQSIVRLMCSFDTTDGDVDDFARVIREAVG